MRSSDSPFAVRLVEIPPEGLERSYDLSGSFATEALAGTEANAAESTLAADLTLWKTGHEVLARGRVSGDLTVLCSRCTGVAHVAVNEPFEVLFVPRGSRAHDAEPDDKQPDVEPYDGDELDLAETLREEILLALPIAPLCAETCRGLCPRCGADLNEGPCDCPEEPRDDRLAALRNLKL